jgi:hypothetical protein
LYIYFNIKVSEVNYVIYLLILKESYAQIFIVFIEDATQNGDTPQRGAALGNNDLYSAAKW